jgi:arylsulfatase A-like enzyme
MTRSFLSAFISSWFLVSAAQAVVEVDFSHSYTGERSPLQNCGNITLVFTVDGSGRVTLEATCANADSAEYVNDFNGPVGTVSDPARWGQQFSMVLSRSGTAGGSLRLSNSGTGLSVQGGNPEILDWAEEQITASVASGETGFCLLNLGYANATTTVGTQMNVSGTAYTLDGAAGLVDVSAQGIAGTFTIDSATDADNQGFVLSSVTFDLTAPLVASDAVVSFANSGTGSPFVLSGDRSATVTLDFAIDSAGVISLDASTNSASGTFSARVNEWSSDHIGSVDDPSLLGKTFTLTGRSSGAGGNLAISELGGGGIGIQGENSNRVDGLNYGPDNDKSDPETLSWTLNAPAGLELAFKSWSYLEGNNGDMRVSVGTTHRDFPNMTNAVGTLDLADLPLAHGQSLTFKEIPGIGSTTGAGISGFTFAVVASVNRPEGFDNDAGNQLWTDAANWNPDEVPVAPANAIIDGDDVILDRNVASGPEELRLTDGSLTVTGSGALSMRAMSLGRNLAKDARLVIDGSGLSFRYSGSSATDEFVVGSAAIVETRPDAGGSTPLELGTAKLVLDLGSQWFLDGTHASGPYEVGDRFPLANFGSFSGSTGGLRTRNFDLPPDRRLDLVVTSTSIFYEVVAQDAPTGPNIIMINVDDMAEGMHFGFDGRDAITPTMDRLVSTGLYFNQAFSSSTVCGPSRYSLLTGRYPSRNTSSMFLSRYPRETLGRFGVSDTELESDGQHLGAWLRQAGYRTGMVGKGHLIDDDLSQTSNWAAKGLLTYPQTADPKIDPVTNGKMRHNHRVLAQRMRSYGFDYVESYYKANLLELRNNALNIHNQEWITKGALDFIDENHSGRFFLYMAPTINHGPVRDDLTKTLVGTDPGYTSAGYLPDLDYSFMPTRQEIVNEVVTIGKKEKKSARETWLDYSIQAIINKLIEHGIRDDTLLIFTSDHGEKTLSGPLVWGKSSMFDLGMRTPLIVNWPKGIAHPGRVYEELVSHVDLAPTLLELAGASRLPTRPGDGVSLVPVFNGSTSPVREDVFAEIGYARAVRTKDWKYVAVRYTPEVYQQIADGFLWERVEGNTATGELTEPRPYYVTNRQLGSLAANSHPVNTYYAEDQIYDLTVDPGEDNNLYGQKPAVAYDLKKRLAHYLGAISGRPFRQFDDASREFSPAPTVAPTAPGALQMQFLNPNLVKLAWADAATSELGYLVRKTVNGGNPVLVGEYPAGTTSATVALDPGTEDLVLEVASYNILGDSGVDQDLLQPESWRFRIFGEIDPTLQLAVSQWTNDPDGDGMSTLWEYACGTHPLLGSSVSHPELRLASAANGRFLEYRLPRSRRRGLEFVGSVSNDLLTGWRSGPPHCVIVEDEENHLLFRSSSPVEDVSRQFIRARMINPPAEQP